MMLFPSMCHEVNWLQPASVKINRFCDFECIRIITLLRVSDVDAWTGDVINLISFTVPTKLETVLYTAYRRGSII